MPSGHIFGDLDSERTGSAVPPSAPRHAKAERLFGRALLFNSDVKPAHAEFEVALKTPVPHHQ